MENIIKIKNVSKAYKGIYAVKDVSLEISKGDIYGIMGLSGAGKSTLVRLINRLEEVTSGEIFVNNENINNFNNKKLNEYRKKTGMIFQHFNLLNSRNVKDNIAFPLELAKWNKVDIDNRVDELLELVELKEKKYSYPSELSGGQKQRIAIARALANHPDILLSDESTSALDPKTTNSILDLLKDINKKLGITIILITHQMEVIRKICNRTMIMYGGRLIEEGSTTEIFLNPKNDITKEFVKNIIPEKKKIDNNIDEKIFELNFLGEQANIAYITELIKRFNLEVNILSGSIDTLTDGTNVGHMIVKIKAEEKMVSEACNWLIKEKIQVKEVLND